MRRVWCRSLLSAVTLVMVGCGGESAVPSRNVPVLGPSAEGGPQFLAPAGFQNLSPVICPKQPEAVNTAGIVPNCIEVWGPSSPLTISVGQQVTLACDVWGLASPGAGIINYPEFPLNGVNLILPYVTMQYVTVGAANQSNRTFTVTGYSPTPAAGTNILCALTNSIVFGGGTLRVTGATRVPTSVSVSPSSVNIAYGNQLQLTPHYVDNYQQTDYLNPAPATNWSSSNASVVQVSGSGLLTATGAGTATVQAALPGFPGVPPATVSVTVTGVTGVAISGSHVATVGFNTELTPTLTCSGGCSPQPTISWSTSNPTVATVTAMVAGGSQWGRVRGLAVGTASITATASNVPSAPFSMTVYSPLSVSITGKNSVKPGASCTWTGSASGGVGPYVYSWTTSPTLQNLSGNPYEFTAVAPAANVPSMVFTLNVSDSRGVVGAASKTVTVASSAPKCGLF